MYTYYDYILASGKNETIYNDVTNNLIKRAAQHKRKEVKGFTGKHEVNKLVWYEQTNDISIAIKREKQIKKWNRKWKIRLIEKENPEWNDLIYFSLLMAILISLVCSYHTSLFTSYFSANPFTSFLLC